MSRTPHVCLVTEMPLVLDGRILNQAFTLTRAGYQVSLVDQSVPRWSEGLAALYRRLPAFVVRSCRVVQMAAPPDSAAARLFVMLHKQARPLARRLVSRALIRLHADVYQARSLDTLRTVVPAARKIGAKILYDVRDFDTPHWSAAPRNAKQRRAVAAEQDAIRDVGALTTVNASLADAVARFYHVPPPTVILNCKLVSAELPPDLPELRRQLGFNTARTLLAFTGTTTVGRSLPVIIAAIARMPDVHLALVGITDRSGDLARLAAQHDVRERISFHPPVSAYEVPAYIRSADAAIACIEPVNPNHASALPNKVFEAIAAHLPLIASDLPEMRRVVETYRLGAVFDPSDADDLVRATRTVLADRETFRRNAIAAGAELCWEREGEKLLAVYRALLGPT